MVRAMLRLRVALIAALALAGSTVPAPAAGAQERRTELLRMSFPSEDGSLTPYTFTNGYALMMLMYDSLTWRDADGKPQPWLAQSVRRSGRTVTVRLRRGVRWHDGRPLTAADVVFTYRYMARRTHPRFTLQLRDIASVRQRDERTVVFELRRPSLGFEDQPLADVPILPRHLWEDLPADRAAPRGLPVGSGPYRLMGHHVGRSYTFEPNTQYFKGRPLVDLLEVSIVPKEEDAFSRLKTVLSRDRMDLVPANLPAGSIPDRSRRVTFDDTVSYNGTMLAFNLERPPFNRLAARRAVARALNLEKIAGAARGPGAMAPAQRGAVHPQSAWAPARDLESFDSDAAQIAFLEQGFRPFTVLASDGDGVRLEAAKRVVEQLRRAGARAQLLKVSPDALQRALGRGGRTALFEAAVVPLPVNASYDPAYLRTVFGPPEEAALNDMGYRSARFDRLDERVSAAPTESARKRAVEAELRQIAEDLPAVPLFFGGTTFAYRATGYPSWLGVRGVGLLDKRSFLPGQRPAAASASAPAATDPRDTVADTGGGSLVPYIIAVAALMLLALVIAVARGGRTGTRARGSRRR